MFTHLTPEAFKPMAEKKSETPATEKNNPAEISLASILAELRTKVIHDFGPKYIKKKKISVENSDEICSLLEAYARENGLSPEFSSKTDKVKDTKLKLEVSDYQEFEHYFKMHYTVESMADTVTEKINQEYHALCKEQKLTLNNGNWFTVKTDLQSESAKKYSAFQEHYASLMKKIGFDNPTDGYTFEQKKANAEEMHIRFVPDFFKQQFLRYQQAKLYDPKACQAIDLAGYKVYYLPDANMAFWIEKDGICYTYSHFSPEESKPLTQSSIPSTSIESTSSITSKLSATSNDAKLFEEKSFSVKNHAFTQAVIAQFAEGPPILGHILSNLVLTDESLDVVFSEFCKNVNNKILYFFYLYNGPFFEKMFDKALQLPHDKLLPCLKTLFFYAHDNLFQTHAEKISFLIANAAENQHWDIVRLCLSEATSSTKVSLFESALTHAALHNQTELVQELLRKNVSPSNFYLTDNRGALHCAIGNNNLTLIVDLLVANADINQRKDAQSPTPLISAIMDTRVTAVTAYYLLFQCEKLSLTATYQGKSAVYHAIEKEHPAFTLFFRDEKKFFELLESLIGKNYTQSLAHLLNWYYKNHPSITSFVRRLLQKYSHKTQILLEEIVHQCGETLLEKKDTELLTMLLASGFRQSMLKQKIDTEENTLLHLAVKTSNTDMFRLLVGSTLPSGAALFTQNNLQMGILTLAAEREQWLMLRELMDLKGPHGTFHILPDSAEQQVTNLQNELGFTLLYAISKKQYDIVQDILKLPRINFTCAMMVASRQKLSIHFAIEHGQLEIATTLFKRMQLKNVINNAVVKDTMSLLEAAVLSKETDIDTLCWVLMLRGITHPLYYQTPRKTDLQIGWDTHQPAVRQLLSNQEYDRQLKILKQNIADKNTLAAADFLKRLLKCNVNLLLLFEGLAKTHEPPQPNHAAYIEVLSMFVERDIQFLTKNNTTYLDYLFDYLAKEKSVSNIIVEGDNNLLHIAAKHNIVRPIAALLKHPDLVKKKNKENKSALQLGIQAQHVNVVKEMIQEVKNDGYDQNTLQEALVLLVFKKEQKAALTLLSSCKETAKSKLNGQIALYYAVINNDLDLAKALYEKDKSVALSSLALQGKEISSDIQAWLDKATTDSASATLHNNPSILFNKAPEKEVAKEELNLPHSVNECK